MYRLETWPLIWIILIRWGNISQPIGVVGPPLFASKGRSPIVSEASDPFGVSECEVFFLDFQKKILTRAEEPQEGLDLSSCPDRRRNYLLGLRLPQRSKDFGRDPSHHPVDLGSSAMRTRSGSPQFPSLSELLSHDDAAAATSSSWTLQMTLMLLPEQPETPVAMVTHQINSWKQQKLKSSPGFKVKISKNGVLFVFTSVFSCRRHSGPVPPGRAGVWRRGRVPDEEDGLENRRGSGKEPRGHRGPDRHRLQGGPERSEPANGRRRFVCTAKIKAFFLFQVWLLKERNLRSRRGGWWLPRT